ncbi:thiolase family protein [Alkalihalobacillus sp. BA299]|uniref:thiolase family protein n=1 Tax=Alkalihalobacillus sp. BA299 TaxID=2815938 RepID=UPI001ADB1172|nr:thiolase family protein [Alkalihalobacillus sp. BA299]
MSIQASIVGLGETKMEKVSCKTTLELQGEAALNAVKDAGISMSEIDGVIVAPSLSDGFIMPSVTFCDYMNIYPKYTLAPSIGGAVGAMMVENAIHAINSGACETVLLVGGESRNNQLGRNKAIELLSSVSHPDFEAPYGTLVPGLYSLIAKRHMELYGTTERDLAKVAVAMRYHASLNPLAQFQEVISEDDVLNSKMIADPLHMLDCSPVSNGAGALIITSAERAKSLRQHPVHVIGYGEGYTHEYVTSSSDLTSSGAKQSGERAFGMAGITPSEIDVAMLYDCFTITVLMELEDLGFCEKGTSSSFVQEKGIKLGEGLPINTHGGLLSHGHSGGGSSLFHITEAVRQLRHQADNRQVENAKLACVHSNGGVMSAHGTLILARD